MEPIDSVPQVAQMHKKRRLGTYPPSPSPTVVRKPLHGRRGRLAQILDLPLDLLFEIFAHLEPLDLLRLARSSKRMHEFFMSRRSAWIWKQARSYLHGLPECPPDMSEPQYANLIFSPHCHYCTIEPVPKVIWSTRTRACKSCFPLHFQQVKYLRGDPRFSALPAEGWNFAQVTGNIIHCAAYMPITSRDTSRQIFNLDILQKLTDEYARIKNDPPQIEAWFAAARERHEAWAKTTEMLTNWQDSKAEKRGLELDAARQRRLDVVIRNLTNAGWGEELRRMDIDLLRRHDLVKVPRDLTDRGWVKIHARMTAFMESVQNSRQEKSRQDVITARRMIFSRYVATCDFHHVTTAPLSELSQIEPLRSIIEESPPECFITFGSFPSPTTLFQLFCLWQRQKKYDIVHIMKRSRLVPSDVNPVHINLATTFFYCEGPGWQEPIGQHAILAHPATFAWHPDCKPPSAYLKRLFQDFRQEFWNFGGNRVSFHESAYLAARSIVRACGCDPEITTAISMDLWNPIIECVSCETMGSRLVMTWRRGVIHAVEHLNTDMLLPQWAILNPNELCYAQALSRIAAEAPLFRCPMCYISGDANFMNTHIRDRHIHFQKVTITRQPPSVIKVPTLTPFGGVWPLSRCRFMCADGSTRGLNVPVT